MLIIQWVYIYSWPLCTHIAQDFQHDNVPVKKFMIVRTLINGIVPTSTLRADHFDHWIWSLASWNDLFGLWCRVHTQQYLWKLIPFTYQLLCHWRSNGGTLIGIALTKYENLSYNDRLHESTNQKTSTGALYHHE